MWLGREQGSKSYPLSFVPSLEYIDLMETTQYMNEGELRILADTYDSVYLHPVCMRTEVRVSQLFWDLPYPCQPHRGKKKLNRQDSPFSYFLSDSPLSPELIFMCLPGHRLCPEAGRCGPGG